MKIDSGQLKTFFLDARLVTMKQFEDSLKKSQETNQKIGDILVAGGFITEEQLKSAEAYLLGVPFMNIENENIPPEILKIIPESIARANHIIAFKKDGNNLEVAMLDPDDIRTIEFIKKASPSLKILPRLTTPEGIKRGESAEESEELKKVAQEIPVIRIVDSLMKHAILQRASDVHIEPSEEGVVVRYRVDGILKDVMMLPISATAGVVARIKVLSNLKLDEHRLPQDGRFKIESQEFKYSVRVSVLPVLNGEKVVMRLLAEGEKTHSLEGLGLAGKYLEKVRDNLMRP